LILLGFDASYSLPYHHQTTVERVNKEVLRYTRVILLIVRDERDRSFYVIAKLAMRAINSSIHKDINCAPRELVLGIFAPLDLPIDHNERFAAPRNAKDIIRSIVSTQLAVMDRAQRYQARHTDKYLLPNADHPQLLYRIGQYVTVTYPDGPPTRLDPPVMGPFQIIARSRSQDKYTLLDLISDKEHEYHFRRLRLFNVATYHQLTPRDTALLNSSEFLVEDILDHRGDINYRRTLEFLVSFTGYDATYNDWLPTNAVCRHPRMASYLITHPQLRRTVMRYEDN
jgi:hypothetical protein